MAEPRCGWHAEARCLLPDGHDGPHETPRSIIAADRDRLARENDDLRKQLHDVEVQAARPEPVTIDPGPHIHEWIDDLDECAVVGCDAVHPADVQVGDVVEVTHQHEHVRIVIEGEVYMLADDSRHRFHLRGYGSPEIGDKTTVRRLRRAEPQPDPEQVEAVYYLLGERHPSLPIAELRETARELVRRGVVVRDEH